MQSYAIWHARPVFVTSTFRDMHAERDYLHNHVFPELEERLRERFHHLEPIDLRWGVETVSVDKEQEKKELLVLKVCLAEIERSRPFLIALIGDRYGWIPPQERLQAAAQEAGYQGELPGKSITALEIEFGVLDSLEQRRRTWFYFRDPLPYSEIDTAADYSEEFSQEPGAHETHDRLVALKARIERQMPDRVRHYHATWDAKNQCVTGLEVWGKQVLEDLWSDLEEETREYLHRPAATWQEQERWTLEQFIETQCRDFIGREETIKQLRSLATSPAAEGQTLQAEGGQAWGACVTGASGSGKSSLFAQMCRLLRKQDVLVLAHAAGISTRSTQVDALLQRWIQELAEFLGISDPAAELTAREDLEREFGRLLSLASNRQRVVCLIDALNQFERTPAAQHLTWLPRLWPQNARLLATAIPGSESAALEQRADVETIPLPLLDEKEAEQIAKTVCRRYHKSLHPEVLRALISKKLPEGTPAAGIPLWLELALEELLLLDADDFARAEKEFAGTSEEKLHALLLDVAGKLPPDVESLYSYLLQRTEEVHGEKWARSFANLIAVTRGGLRESDLQALLPKENGEEWDGLRFAALRRSFRAHLVQRGALGQWDFFHAQMRAAVEKRNLADHEEKERIHTAIADHLEGLSREDPLRQLEYMFHLIRADDKLRAARHLGDSALSEPEQTAAILNLLDEILVDEKEDRNPGLEWTCSLLKEDAVASQCQSFLCHRLIFNLYVLLEVYASANTRSKLARTVRDALSSLVLLGPSSNESLRDLGLAHKAIADTLLAEGQYGLALETYEEALTITGKLVEINRSNRDWLHDLAIIHCFIGNLLLDHGEYDTAFKHYQESLAISQELVEADPENPSWQRSLSIGYEKLGDLREAQGRYDEAIGAYQQDLIITKRLAAQEPQDYRLSRDLSVIYERIGDVLIAQDRPTEALQLFHETLKIRNRLQSQYSHVLELQYDTSVGLRRCGDTLLALGQVDQADKFYREAFKRAELLVGRDSSSLMWQREIAACHERLGDTLLMSGKADGALMSYKAAVDIEQHLIKHESNNAGWLRDLAICSYKAAISCQRVNDRVGARHFFHLCWETLQLRARVGMFLDPPLVELLKQLEQLGETDAKH